MNEKQFTMPSGGVEGKAERTEKLRERIRLAKENALDIFTDELFLQRYADLCIAEKFPIPPDDFDPEEFNAMESRVLKAMARADTLVEFRELLSLIDGLPPERAQDMIEHENAHANVAEQLETVDFKGYGMVFFQDNGEVLSVVPTVLTDRVDGADKITFLEESMQVLQAPDVYGHKMSDNDIRKVDQMREIIKPYQAG